MPEFEYILCLGSNTEDAQRMLDQALAALSVPGIKIKRTTRPGITPPYLHHLQGNFINQSVLVVTAMGPVELFAYLQKIEKKLGRVHYRKGGARAIDIDITWYSGGIFRQGGLKIPHYANRARYWVLEQAVELKPGLKDLHTGLGYSDMVVLPMKTTIDFFEKKQKSEKITVITCYDYTFANLLARTSVDAVLVGDTMGTVIQGHDTTLPVEIDDIIYHSRAVRRGLPDKFIISDMPFMSYQVSDEEAISAAGLIMKKAGCNAVKLEGPYIAAIEKMVKAGIPVMGHLGLTPQSFYSTGYRVQARDETDQHRLIEDAMALEAAGCFSIVLELIPAALAKRVSEKLSIPTIGIGAGNATDGQVLVLQDMLGLNPDFNPRFLRRFKELGNEVMQGVESYCQQVRSLEFPSDDESFS